MTCARYTESDSGRLKVVTSTTRPTGASRYIGQHIYETDTDRRLYFDGTGWVILSEPAQTWAVTSGGITGGSISTTGSTYERSNGRCRIEGRLTFGASPSGLADPTITLPFAVGFLASRQLTFAMYDNAGVQYPGTHAGAVAGGSVVPLYSIDASVARAANAAITTSSPFSVGSGDVWELTGEFRMNSRYS